MKKKLHVNKILPFLILIVAMITTYTAISLDFQTTESLREFHLSLKDFHARHPLATPLLFIACYIAYALLMLPGIIFLSLIAGSLFPQPFCTLYVIIGATAGASILYFAARTAFREILTSHSKGLISKLEEGFRNNATNYMLFLRLVPFITFRLGNLAGAFFDVPYRTFAWTTSLGMIPSILVYTETGKSLSAYLDFSERTPLDPWNLVDHHLIAALTILAILCLIPIFFKKKQKKAMDPNGE